MKKLFFTTILSICSVLSLSAMSYEVACEQARFLTDKMAYELNLNSQQYEYCYEINLDYLMSVETADDAYGAYLSYRNADLRHILYDWQYTAFAAVDYFLRPLAWLSGRWVFPIYRHYAAGYYYYDRPRVYFSYRGGHGRYYHHGGFYASLRPHWNGGLRGMDRSYRPHGVEHRGVGGHGINHRSGMGYHNPSSTRTTVHSGHQPGMGHNSHGAGSGMSGRGSMDGNRGSIGHSGSMGGSRGSVGHSGSMGGTRSSGSMGGSRGSVGSHSSAGGRGFGGGASRGHSGGGGGFSGGHGGGHRGGR